MSHECPDCGVTCYCNGDVDDCCFNTPMEVYRCKHCPPEQFDDDEEEFLEEDE